MKNTMLGLLLLVLFAAVFFIPEDELYKENFWELDSPHFGPYSDDYVRERIADLKKQIQAADAAGSYPVREAYLVDKEIQKMLYVTRFPDVWLQHGILSYGDEAEVAPPHYWLMSGVQTLSREVRNRWAGAPGELAAYEELKHSSEEEEKFWRPKLIRKTRTRHIQDLVSKRMFVFFLLVLLLVLWRVKKLGWAFKRVFNRRTLQSACYLLSLGVSLSASPVLALQLAKQKKKDKKRLELALGAFGDFAHDRQQFGTLRLSVDENRKFVLFTQHRQADGDGPKLSLITIGLQQRLNPSLSLEVTGGPQYSPNKGRFDQIVAFVNVSWRGGGIEANAINRLSWGIDGMAPFADRHVLFGRFPPMPPWLLVEAEIRRSKNGFDECFLGPVIKIGQVFPEGWMKQAFGGLYVYPYCDFVKNDCDLRVGASHSFAW